MPNIASTDIPNDVDELEVNFLKYPVLLFCGMINDQVNSHTPLHKHTHYMEILFVDAGEAMFIIDGKKYAAKKGDIVIFNRDIEHEEYYYAIPETRIYYCGICNIHIEGLDELCIVPSNLDPIINANDQLQRISNLMAEIYHERFEKKAGNHKICSNLSENLIVLIIRFLNEKTKVLESSPNLNQSQVIVKKVNDYINENYLQKFSLDEIANSIHISKYYISHAYKNITGITPYQYCLNLRIDQAKRLLLMSDIPVQEIARLSGYENTNHFYRPFKKISGYTPEEYRKSIENSLIPNKYHQL